jgi:hypothetical protein
MKRIFICSPYAGDIEHNLQYARAGCGEAVANGLAPFAPHLLYPQFLIDNSMAARNSGIKCGLAFLDVCDELWLMDKFGVSEGMQRELIWAQKHGISIQRRDVKII